MTHVMQHVGTTIRTLWKENKSMTFLGFFSIGLVFLTAFAALFDGRIILNVNGWIKPMKFGISFIFYAFTLLWMLRFVQNRPKTVMVISVATLIASLLEMIFITMQVVRNTTSHFNTSTSFDATIYYLMGGFVVVIWVANFALAIVMMRQKFLDRSLGIGIRLGLVIALIGGLVGFVMSSNTTESQLATIEATGDSPIVGAHSVGVDDAAEPGIPFVGWNTESGDLRVAHFFGLHGLQAVPLLAILLMFWQTPLLDDRKRAQLTRIGGLGYLGFTLLTFWQAMRGQSFIAPDGITLAALGGLMLMMGIATLVVVRQKSAELKTRFPQPA